MKNIYLAKYVIKKYGYDHNNISGYSFKYGCSYYFKVSIPGYNKKITVRVSDHKLKNFDRKNNTIQLSL